MDFKTGDSIECSISNTRVTGKIKFYDGKAYICHNNSLISGSVPSDNDRLGYPYSWAFTFYADNSMSDNVRELKKVGNSTTVNSTPKKRFLTINQEE